MVLPMQSLIRYETGNFEDMSLTSNLSALHGVMDPAIPPWLVATISSENRCHLSNDHGTHGTHGTSTSTGLSFRLAG